MEFPEMIFTEFSAMQKFDSYWALLISRTTFPDEVVKTFTTTSQ